MQHLHPIPERGSGATPVNSIMRRFQNSTKPSGRDTQINCGAVSPKPRIHSALSRSASTSTPVPTQRVTAPAASRNGATRPKNQR
jgi:hypothetical protein